MDTGGLAMSMKERGAKMGRPSRFVVCYTTRDGVRAVLHAYADGDGSLRDNNHVREIVREFTHGNEGEVSNRPPEDGERVMFEIFLHVCATRRGTSNYFGCDYRQIQPCPHCVAEAGMEIYVQIKHLLRRARKEKKNAIAMRRDKSRL